MGFALGYAATGRAHVTTLAAMHKLQFNGVPVWSRLCEAKPEMCDSIERD